MLPLLCFSTPRTKSDGGNPSSTLTIRSADHLHAILTERAERRQITVLYWSAEWLSLDAKASEQVKQIAALNPEVAFVRCNIDVLPETARTFAVHDLPAFHVFDGYSLVERLHGLSGIKSIHDVLQHHMKLKVEADTGSPVASLQHCWEVDSLTGSLPSSPSCKPGAASSSSTSQSIDGSYDSAPMSATTPSAHARTLRPSTSMASNATTRTERSYKPQYTRLSDLRQSSMLSLQGSNRGANFAA